MTGAFMQREKCSQATTGIPKPVVLSESVCESSPKDINRVSVSCVYKLLNPAAPGLRADLKLPFHTLHLSSQYQIRIYRFISQISQHQNNMGTFYYMQTQRCVTPDGFTNICRIWWRNKKRNCNTVPQKRLLRFSVHCFSNPSMIFLKLLTQSKCWQLLYIWLVISLGEPFHLQNLDECRCYTQNECFYLSLVFWEVWGGVEGTDAYYLIIQWRFLWAWFAVQGPSELLFACFCLWADRVISLPGWSLQDLAYTSSLWMQFTADWLP